VAQAVTEVGPELRTFLSRLAAVCREALERMTPAQRGVGFIDFPRGTCGPVAELMGRLVFEATHKSGLYLSGTAHPDLPRQQSHAWLEVDGLLVDLTHDQFTGTGLVGWVFESSPWHALFETEKLPLCLDPRNWLAYPHAAYAVMKQAAQMSGAL
jgi:hypothetical protein